MCLVITRYDTNFLKWGLSTFPKILKGKHHCTKMFHFKLLIYIFGYLINKF